MAEVTPSPGPKKPALCVICAKLQTHSVAIKAIEESPFLPSRSRSKKECRTGQGQGGERGQPDLKEVKACTNSDGNADENAKLFEFLCESLNVNLDKRKGWDFSKETLPLCPSCTGMSGELMEIGVQLLELETRFERMVQRLRQMVIESEDKDNRRRSGSTKNVGDKRGRKGISCEVGRLGQSLEFEDERYLSFRRQVVIETEIRGCKATARDILKEGKLKKPIRKSKSTANYLHPSSIINDNIISSATRRSQRVRAKAVRSEDKQTTLTKKSAELKLAKPKVDYFKAKVHQQDCDILSVVCKDDLSTAPVPLKNYILKKKLMDESNFEKTRNLDSQPSIQDVEPELSEVKKSREELLSKDNDTDEGMESCEDSDSKGSKPHHSKRTGSRSRSRHWKADKKTGKILFEDIEITPVPNGFKCSKCDVIIAGDHSSKNKQRMKSHLMLKHIERFVCLICDKVAANKKYLDFHVKTVHEKSVVVLCTVCEKPFTSKNAMKRHAWNHQNEEEKKLALAAGKKRQVDSKNHALIECGQCGKRCKGPYNLKRHEETHMDQAVRIKHMCQICGALYSAPETLRSHIKLAHENNSMLQWLKCPHCPKKFPQPGRLDKHMRSHTGDKPFICSECGKAFSQQTLLKVHMLKHKNMRPHKCEHCEMSFYRRYHLQRHTQVYHESLNPPSKKQSYRSENGTRKLSQKKTKKKDIKVVHLEAAPISTTAVIEIARDIGVIIQNPQEKQTGSQTLDTHQLVTLVETGPTDAGAEPMQHFSFTSSTSCPYPFSYTFNTTTSTTNESHE